MDSLPPLVTSLCRAKDAEVQIGACQCIALSASDPASAAAYVAAGAAAAVCSILKGGAAEPLAQPAAAAAAALTVILAGAQQFVECGGVVALKKAAAMGDSVKVCVSVYNITASRFEILTPAKVPALKALHHSVQLVAEAAAQARECGWLQVAQELLSAAPAGEPSRLLWLRLLCEMRLAGAATSAAHIPPQSRLRQRMRVRGWRQTTPPTGGTSLIFNRQGPLFSHNCSGSS